MTRRQLLTAMVAGLMALAPPRVAAHHKPGHHGGPAADTYGAAYDTASY